MNNIVRLWEFMKGNKIKYLGAILSIGLAVLCSLITPLVIRVTIDNIIGNKPIDVPEIVNNFIAFLGGKDYLSQNLWICASALVMITILRGVFLFYKGRLSAIASENIAKNIREKLYDHIQHLPYSFHKNVDTGDLIQRSSSDVETIRRFLSIQLVEVGRAVFMVSIALIIMLSMDVKMTIVAMAFTPIIFTFAFFFFQKVQKAFKISDEAEAKMSTTIQENLSGVRVVRAFAREKYEINKFEEKNYEYKKVTYKLIVYLAWYWGLSDLFCLGQIGMVLIFGAYWSSLGLISLGTVVAFTTYEGMLLWPIRQFGRILTDLGKTLVSVERIGEILDEPIEKPMENEVKPQIHGEIVFNNICFHYTDDDKRMVLRDISFNVKKGETIAVMGKTGSGKSSLVHLLARLYDYQQGSIKIDGIELKNIDKKWVRQHVGVVLQEPFLFSKTIEENINFTKKGSRDAIVNAARIAAVHDVIENFDKGYKTPVGEKGVTLSGGQKQRIAIARTIINNNPILVFDDSLSAVDTETDLSIRKALKTRKKGITTFIISHRISTLKDADQIIVLDKGRIVQRGTHDKLIKENGLYKETWEIQNALEDNMLKELA